jgi:hypothetical protein
MDEAQRGNTGAAGISQEGAFSCGGGGQENSDRLAEAFDRFSSESGTVSIAELRDALRHGGVDVSEQWLNGTVPELNREADDGVALEDDRVTYAGFLRVHRWTATSNRPERGYDEFERERGEVFTNALEVFEDEFWARAGFTASYDNEGNIRLSHLQQLDAAKSSSRSSLVAERDANLAKPPDERSVRQSLVFSGPTVMRAFGERLSCEILVCTIKRRRDGGREREDREGEGRGEQERK